MSVMLKRLYPALHLKTLLDLTPDVLKERGLKGLMLDLDNTLVEWGQVQIAPETAAWVREMKNAGFKLCIISNALEDRVKVVGEKLGIPWVAQAIKPRKSPFKKALALLGTTPGETATVGDQLFTDVWGGNRMALFTIWTRPISGRELFFTKIVRRLEKLVAKRLKKKGIISE